MNGWFNFLNLRSLIDNLLLVGFFILFFLIIHKSSALKNRFRSVFDFLQVFFLSVSCTVVINYFVMNFPETPTSKVTVILFTLIIGMVPFVALFFKFCCENLLERVGITNNRVSIASFTLGILIVLLGLALLKHPSLSHFVNKKYIVTSQDKSDESHKPNIIWLVLDTARRDHFSCYGYERETTPYIDQFAKESVLFTNYISTAPWTLASHASMFTGLYSSKHGAHYSRKGTLFFPLSRDCITLSEILQLMMSIGVNGMKCIILLIWKLS